MFLFFLTSDNSSEYVLHLPRDHVTLGSGFPSTKHSNSNPTLLSGTSTIPSGSILTILAGVVPSGLGGSENPKYTLA